MDRATLSRQSRSVVAAGMCALASPALLPAQSLSLTHVNVVDVTTGAIARDQTITLADGRIASIRSSAPTDTPSSAVRDYHGRYVIPGLWDMHTHLDPDLRSALPLFLANGVTGVRDMGSPQRFIHSLRDSIDQGTLAGPRIISAGAIVENASWLDGVRRMTLRIGDTALFHALDERVPVGSVESARDAVDSMVARHAAFIKIRTDPPLQTTLELLHRARVAGIPVAGHWPMLVSPRLASDSGYRSFEHVPLTVANGRLIPALDLNSDSGRRALFDAMKRNGTAYTPTLVAGVGASSSPDTADQRILADTASVTEPRMRYVSRSLLAVWRSMIALMREETVPRPPVQPLFESARRDLRGMVDAGVVILSGADDGVPLVFPGFAIADELQLFVSKIGLTPLQALQTATVNPAIYFRATNDFGTVSAGSRADLVVLDANPLEDITNLRRIAAVVRAGRLFDRAALDALLADVARDR